MEEKVDDGTVPTEASYEDKVFDPLGFPWHEDEDDFLTGVTCNPDEPEACESCQ